MIPSWWWRPLTIGCTGEDVSTLQRILGVPVDGSFTEETAAYVRGFQKMARAKVTGVVDRSDAETIGDRATGGLAPVWFTAELGMFSIGGPVRELRQRLRLTDDDKFEINCEQAVRRFQSANGMVPTGRVDEATARLIGD